MPPEEPAEVQDPVCGERFPPELSEFRSTRRGKTYHFCSSHCHVLFGREPEKYVRR